MTRGGDGVSEPSAELLEYRRQRQIEAMSKPGCKRSSARFGFGRTSPQLRADVSTQALVDLYLNGNSLRATAKLVRMSSSGVQRRLLQAGVEIRTEFKPGRPKRA